MATLAFPMVIADGAYNRAQLNIYQYQNQGDQSAVYIHLKTNILRYCSAMYMIEAIGYNYGTAQSVRCAFTGYMYDLAGQTIYNPTQFTNYPGLTAHGQYLSSDNYLCLRFSAANAYFLGFVLNVYQMNPIQVQPAVQINIAATNATAGAHF